jgi:hypothetical protein
MFIAPEDTLGVPTVTITAESLQIFFTVSFMTNNTYMCHVTHHSYFSARTTMPPMW